MVEMANWNIAGRLGPDVDRAGSQVPGADAYTDIPAPGQFVSPHRQKKMEVPSEKEPVALWGIVVGSILALALIRRGFRGARA